MAFMLGDPPMIHLLLEKKANPDLKSGNGTGETPPKRVLNRAPFLQDQKLFNMIKEAEQRDPRRQSSHGMFGLFSFAEQSVVTKKKKKKGKKRKPIQEQSESRKIKK
jgi:hypothetical protein